MPSAKRPSVRLQHMLENIDGVLDMTAGLELEAILESFMLVRATERVFQIISEATKELPAEIRAMEPDVPWRDIIGLGNLLRHEYYRIDPAVLAAILRDELPMTLGRPTSPGARHGLSRRRWLRGYLS